MEVCAVECAAEVPESTVVAPHLLERFRVSEHVLDRRVRRHTQTDDPHGTAGGIEVEIDLAVPESAVDFDTGAEAHRKTVEVL